MNDPLYVEIAICNEGKVSKNEKADKEIRCSNRCKDTSYNDKNFNDIIVTKTLLSYNYSNDTIYNPL